MARLMRCSLSLPAEIRACAALTALASSLLWFVAK